MTRRQPNPPNRSSEDLPTLEESSDQGQIIDAVNRITDSYNFSTKFISFQSNFDGSIVEVSFPATTDVTIQHFLGVTPKFRVILRQEGNGVLSDIPSEWNDKYIVMRNNGAVTVSATILIARE